MKKEAKEEKQINIPVSKFFKKKMKCDLSRVEFSFSAGELDVLGYNRKDKCFYVSEGKRSANIASLGHAVGQLIAYISMIQENGYDFLNRVSKEERLELTDFSTFLETKTIKVCFFVGLPAAYKEKLLGPANLVLKNLGDFGNKIGIIFATKNKCELARPAIPMIIEIRKNYSKETFLHELNIKLEDKLNTFKIEHMMRDERFPFVLQFKERDGNPYLHYEIWIKQQKKSDKNLHVEIGFHLEFAKAHLESKNTRKRKRALQKVMKQAGKALKQSSFEYMPNWGKQWSKISVLHETESIQLTDIDMSQVVDKFSELLSATKPMFDKINWGRKYEKKINDFENLEDQK